MTKEKKIEAAEYFESYILGSSWSTIELVKHTANEIRSTNESEAIRALAAECMYDAPREIAMALGITEPEAEALIDFDEEDLFIEIVENHIEEKELKE